MKRPQKLALLTQVLTSNNATESRRRLTQAAANAPKTLILIDDFESDIAPSLAPTDLVSFSAKGERHLMALGEVGRYARQHGIRILVVKPSDQSIQP
ncbi:MAG: hypothetical protein EOO39_18845 [Cytophagaceae bacterium]|nr:MAG: hypothetical protein EOO39_18845 [Cytophagaceae bacterium]